MASRFGRWDRAYRAKAHALKKQTAHEDIPCAHCGRHIDTDLPYTDPMAFTANHITALANGGRMLGELEPMHRSCNSRVGARSGVSQMVVPPETSRSW